MAKKRVPKPDVEVEYDPRWEDPDALTQRIGVRISQRTKEAIEIRAKKARRSPADWVRVIIEDATGTGPPDADTEDEKEH